MLLDLPDFDSVEASHRLEVDRLVRLVDLLVWVVDPQKYADAALHDRYLRPLAGHAAAMLVVLNQSDRLGADADRAREDLARLLASAGLGEVPVLAASARTGDGLGALRSVLEERVARREAALARLGADVEAAAGALAAAAGAGEARPGCAAGTAPSCWRRSARRPGCPPSRRPRSRPTGAAARSPPACRGCPGCGTCARTRSSGCGSATPRGRTSARPCRRRPASSVAQVDAGIRALAGDAARGLPDPWPALARRAATAAEPELADRLDRAVAGAELRMTRPRWWTPVRWLQRLLAGLALAGVLWLAVLAGLGYLQLDDAVPTPDVAGIPAPTALLAGGLLAGIVLAFLARLANGAGARRRARRARKALDERVAAVAGELVLAPLEAELAVLAELHEALATARRP